MYAINVYICVYNECGIAHHPGIEREREWVCSLVITLSYDDKDILVSCLDPTHAYYTESRGVITYTCIASAACICVTFIVIESIKIDSNHATIRRKLCKM